MTREEGAGDGTGATGAASGLIQHYEQIAAASHSMLEASRIGDWDQVERLAVRCHEMIAALKRAAAGDEVLDAAEVARRMDLLRRILEDDAQIRVRAEPWLVELETFMARPRPAAKISP